MLTNPSRQPWLHRLNVCVRGNVTALSGPSGDMVPRSAAGLYVDDCRVISEMTVLVDGEAPAPVADEALGARAEFLASARNLCLATPDPVVEVRRHRDLGPGGMTERIAVVNRASVGMIAELSLRLASDGAPIGSVKAGHLNRPGIAPTLTSTGGTFVSQWHTCEVAFDPAPDRLDTLDTLDTTDLALMARFRLDLRPQREVTVLIRVTAVRTRRSALDADAGGELLDWHEVRVGGADPRLEPTVSSSLADLRALALRDPEAPQDPFVGAGTPWYLTLFGRDSIWAARLTLPIGTQLARGTLHSLARRQGRRHDPVSAEAPGKIPHEVRRFPYVDPETGMTLSTVYYGTVDATALWVILLYDAWCWGMGDDTVRELLDPLDRAVHWLLTDAVPDADGLLKYLDVAGTGLSNQGWKDSGDSVRFRDGTVASAPIALVEAQAYAVSALECAARLFEACGRQGAGEARRHASSLREVVRERFWVTGAGQRYLGVAVDGSDRLVDGLASNMGHVLGTSCLTAEEAALVAAALTGPELLDPFGVRTLGTVNGGYNPIGYHTGSIWTHDTAIAALGLSQEGFATEAVKVISTLLASAEAFDYRWPELYSGEPVMGRPAPYPAACRPQAWSAASAVALLTVALGLRPDPVTRTLNVHAVRPAAYGAMRVKGLRFGPGVVDLDVTADGTVTVLRATAGVRVQVHDAPEPPRADDRFTQVSKDR